MTRVSYQAILGDTGRSAQPEFTPLGPSDIATRRKEATRDVTVRLSKAQRAWLRDIERRGEVDASAVVRALVDVGRALDIDWDTVGGAGALRDEVRAAVRVRRPTTPA